MFICVRSAPEAKSKNNVPSSGSSLSLSRPSSTQPGCWRNVCFCHEHFRWDVSMVMFILRLPFHPRRRRRRSLAPDRTEPLEFGEIRSQSVTERARTVGRWTHFSSGIVTKNRNIHARNELFTGRFPSRTDVIGDVEIERSRRFARGEPMRKCIECHSASIEF